MSERAATSLGPELHRFVAELYPLCRSLTGDGVRETLRRIAEIVPLTVHEVASGTRVLDWTVPPEWNVRDAWVKNAAGERVIDFRRSNLHLVGYSTPLHTSMPLADLAPHLHSLPEHPDWVPYRTSYYDEAWGFCLSQRERDALPDGEYEVMIDATLAPGHLTYGECFLPGDSADEVLISCHVCHPSLANDNCAGIAVAAYLAKRLAAPAHRLAARPRRYGYRFLFIPGTIGSLTWLARSDAAVARIRHGLVLSCLGDGGCPTYKQSRRGDAEIDRMAAHVLRASGCDHAIVPFEPWGYDERQYCSPGFDLPVGCLMRTPHGRFAEYHSSADDLGLVRAEALAGSLALLEEIVAGLEANRVYRSRNPHGEPQLGRRGLFDAVGGRRRGVEDLALLWVLNLADGRHTLLDVAERSGLALDTVAGAAATLVAHDLLAEVA